MKKSGKQNLHKTINIKQQNHIKLVLRYKSYEQKAQNKIVKKKNKTANKNLLPNLKNMTER